MLSTLETLVYPSQLYSTLMQQYSNFFASLFGNEFLGFGYEKLDENGFYQALSNHSRIAEIFIETKAFQVIQCVSKELSVTEHHFIYPGESADQSIYNKFRRQLDKELSVYATFYVIEPCLNFQHVFVWNFRPPAKSMTLTKWENKILLCFINNRKSIQYVLDDFKKIYYRTISKKIVPIKLLNPSIEKKTIHETSTLGEKLVEKHWLTENDLYLKNMAFSKKEAQCTYFYLQGMSAKEIANKIYLSRRTVEDYMKVIKAKLGVKSRSEFHARMKILHLWRDIL